MVHGRLATRDLLNRRARWAVAAGGVAVALARLVAGDTLLARMDETFLILLAVAALAVTVPWERLTSFRAGNVEIALAQERVVQSAVDAIGTSDAGGGEEGPEVLRARERVRDTLDELDPLLPRVRGSRVLWIDDKPNPNLALRRLFRALGISVVIAKSSARALAFLDDDNDYDLIVSDVQRYEQIGDSKQKTLIGGAKFVAANIRGHHDDHVRRLPVVFYTGYKPRLAMEYTREAREADPPAAVCRTTHDFLWTTITTLYRVRSEPLKSPPVEKKPTLPEGYEPASRRRKDDEVEMEGPFPPG